MLPVDVEETPGTTKIVFGKGQPEYSELPALVYPEGTVVSRWKLDASEIVALLENGGYIDLFMWPFGQPIQPVNMGVTGYKGDE